MFTIPRVPWSTRLVAAVLCAVPLAATQATPKPATPTYAVKISLDQEYIGTTTFAIDAKGLVTGEMTIDSTGAVMTLSGSVKDGVWTFEKMSFTLAALNCSGVTSGTATVPADLGVISGKIHVEAGCGTDQPRDGTFTFTRTPKS
jgi:hypothetical protein